MVENGNFLCFLLHVPFMILNNHFKKEKLFCRYILLFPPGILWYFTSYYKRRNTLKQAWIDTVTIKFVNLVSHVASSAWVATPFLIVDSKFLSSWKYLLIWTEFIVILYLTVSYNAIPRFLRPRQYQPMYSILRDNTILKVTNMLITISYLLTIIRCIESSPIFYT